MNYINVIISILNKKLMIVILCKVYFIVIKFYFFYKINYKKNISLKF